MAVAIGGLTAAAALWFMIPAGLRGEKLPLKTRLRVLTQPRVMPALTTTLLYMTGGFAVLTYIAPLAIQGAGLSRDMLPAILLIYGTGAAIGNYLGGQMADRWGAQRVVIAALILNTAMLFLFSAIAHLPSAWVGPAFLLALLPWGILSGRFRPRKRAGSCRLRRPAPRWRCLSTAPRSISAWLSAPSSAVSSCDMERPRTSAGSPPSFR